MIKTNLTQVICKPVKFIEAIEIQEKFQEKATIIVSMEEFATGDKEGAPKQISLRYFVNLINLSKLSKHKISALNTGHVKKR